MSLIPPHDFLVSFTRFVYTSNLVVCTIYLLTGSYVMLQSSDVPTPIRYLQIGKKISTHIQFTRTWTKHWVTLVSYITLHGMSRADHRPGRRRGSRPQSNHVRPSRFLLRSIISLSFVFCLAKQSINQSAGQSSFLIVRRATWLRLIKDEHQVRNRREYIVRWTTSTSLHDSVHPASHPRGERSDDGAPIFCSFCWCARVLGWFVCCAV